MKDKNKLDLVKIKGILGFFLLIILIIIGKLERFHEVSYEIRYWGGILFLFGFGLVVWLTQDWIKRWYGQ